MYKDYFRLREEPFNITPDPRFLYLTAQHREAMNLQRQEDEQVPLPEQVDARLLMMLEEARPAVQPGEVISWYLEARDRKPDNPPALSELHMIVILPFELWGAYGFEAGQAPGPGEAPEIPTSLAEILMETWDVHRQKAVLAQKQYESKAITISDQLL